VAVDGPADLDAAVATPPLASGQTATYTLWVKAPARPRLGVVVTYSQPDTSDPSLFNNLGFAASLTFRSHRYPCGRCWSVHPGGLGLGGLQSRLPVMGENTWVCSGAMTMLTCSPFTGGLRPSTRTTMSKVDVSGVPVRA